MVVALLNLIPPRSGRRFTLALAVLGLGMLVVLGAERLILRQFDRMAAPAIAEVIRLREVRASRGPPTTVVDLAVLRPQGPPALVTWTPGGGWGRLAPGQRMAVLYAPLAQPSIRLPATAADAALRHRVVAAAALLLVPEALRLLLWLLTRLLTWRSRARSGQPP